MSDDDDYSSVQTKWNSLTVNLPGGSCGSSTNAGNTPPEEWDESGDFVFSQEEEVEETAPEEEVAPKPRHVPKPKEDEGEGKELSEAEQKMLEVKRRHEQEDEAKLQEFEEQRRIQREKEEEELRILKEKQERRKREREEEERELAERKRQDEERRKQDEDARKEKAEADKRKKEEEKQRKLQMMQGNLATGEGGKNFVINKQTKGEEQFQKFGNIVKAKAEMGLTKEQQDEIKKNALANIVKPLESGLSADALKAKIKELHARISKLEAEKYDLEKRADRQTYDLKELNERQRQISRNKALKKGIDPDAVNSKFPPPKPPPPKILHGSARPPEDWGRKENEELELLLKNRDTPRYQEVAPVEGAKPPMEAVPMQFPAEDEVVDEEEEE